MPERIAGILGRWFSEGEETSSRGEPAASRRGGAPIPGTRTHVRLCGGGSRPLPVASSRERGVLRVVHNEAGAVVKLYWATYPFKRVPFTFGEP